MAGYWRCGPFDLPLDRTHVMGVVNVTPDSFSDGGRFLDPGAAVAHAHELADAGASIVDVGGESTRPGAAPVAIDEEIRRVVPVVERLAADGLCVSVDTRHASVAAAALGAGAAILNDVSAGRAGLESGGVSTLDLAAAHGAGLVLMHMLGEPGTMQVAPEYSDCVAEVIGFLELRCRAARAAGVARDALCVDPGIGFGKTLQHNLELLAGVGRLAALGYPVLVGTSRKSMFGRLLGLEVGERLEATLATVVWAALAGASVVRVHDVAEMRRAAAVADELRCTLGAE